MLPTVLITRPDPVGAQFANQLKRRIGCDLPIVVSPLIRILPCGDIPDLSAVKSLIFTSRNGVATYLEKTRRRDIPCYCVGDATATAAEAAGMIATSCAGTSDALVSRILQDGVAGPCLHIRGQHVTGGIAAQLTAKGVPTGEVILYRQEPQALSQEALVLLRGNIPVILPFFSPRTVRLFLHEAFVEESAHVVALSEKVAAELPKARDTRVVVAERPDAEAMLDAIERLIASWKPLETGNRAQ